MALFRILAVTLLAAWPVQPLAQDRIELVLDWFVNPNHAPIVIAQEKGYFAEAGLEVIVTAPTDPALPPRMVAAGRADLAISYQIQLHLQVHEGLPLRRVGTLIATPLNCLMVVADGPVQQIADLKGKRIGFSVPGVEEALLTTLLAGAGLKMSDVELVNVSWSIAPSVMSGKVDAVIGAYRNFELVKMDMDGVPGRCFFIEEEGIPPHDELIFVANPDRMDADAIARFLGAIERATQYIVNHPEEAWEIFRNSAPELDDPLNARVWPLTIPRFALRPAALDAGRYARFEAWMVEAGLVPEAWPVERFGLELTLP